jgi:deferrochelatase/peroxidase EfeB
MATILETPAPEPLHGGINSPSHPDVPEEPVLNIDNIQGNILAGFNKDHQALLFFWIDDPVQFKNSFRPLIPSIATTAEVLSFNRLFKAMRNRLDSDPTGPPTHLHVTWTGAAFTFEGIRRLAAVANPPLSTDFEDEAFTTGLRQRSSQLGDPTDGSLGDPVNWQVFDGPDDGVNNNRIAHVVFIVAGDRAGDVSARVRDLQQRLAGVTPVHQDVGSNPLAGHEHFGFRDPVSQPGVRGRLSSDPNDVLTVRQNPNNRQQGKPGQELLWPGTFVFGYPAQDSNPDADPEKPFKNPGPTSTAGPEWANDGSFLVFRRLRQDVSKFHSFLKQVRDDLRNQGAPQDVTADLVGARLVGRWRSGAPILRTDNRNSSSTANDTDNPDLGVDDCANNNFEFQEAAEPLKRTSENDPFDCTDEDPQAPGVFIQPARRDRQGAVCPFTAHNRKVYPRDDQTLNAGDTPDPGNPDPTKAMPGTTRLGGDVVRTVELQPDAEGGTEPPPPAVPPGPEGDPIKLNEDDTQSHRIIRQGVFFGPALQGSTPDNPQPDDGQERGLLFLCYQASIENQFEFIIKNWANNPDFKEEAGQAGPPVDPVNQGGGHDPIIGQNATPGQNRIRHFTVTFRDDTGKRQARQVEARDGAGNALEWVIPTGGGYFFAPSIAALQMLSS